MGMINVLVKIAETDDGEITVSQEWHGNDMTENEKQTAMQVMDMLAPFNTDFNFFTPNLHAQN